MKFKDWLAEAGNDDPIPALGPLNRRWDLMHGGLDACSGTGPNQLPSGVKSMCPTTTSAFPTGTAVTMKKMKKRAKR